ncbi:ferredoxin III, nif-specific [Leptospirillum ferriphilum]|jgi:Nif-specific ferredoxin III|uniref:Ferredoxin III n=1 Tax=Leptospirillum ferriphilum TaxID=178606 RepID=A0A2I2MFS1_9BACT|nr:ferredoxin III, nif-specific [Leptospirillum ferriphilum]
MDSPEIVVGMTRGGGAWTPRFVESIDAEKCIGCGRCFKVCGRDILSLMGIDGEGDVVPITADNEDEIDKKVMSIAHPERCVGCEACAKVCPKKCYVHRELAAS